MLRRILQVVRRSMAQRWCGVARTCHRKSFAIRESPRFSTSWTSGDNTGFCFCAGGREQSHGLRDIGQECLSRYPLGSSEQRGEVRRDVVAFPDLRGRLWPPAACVFRSSRSLSRRELALRGTRRSRGGLLRLDSSPHDRVGPAGVASPRFPERLPSL